MKTEGQSTELPFRAKGALCFKACVGVYATFKIQN